MKKINIGIIGPTGRMGSSIITESKFFPNLKISALCEKKSHPSIGKDIDGIKITDDVGACIERSDIIIDFSSPKSTLSLLDKLKNTDTAIVVGTTGFSKSQEKDFKRLSKDLKLLRSSNMSIGINLALNLTNLITQKMPRDTNIEILDIHHNQKLDSPSGTALSLGEEIESVNKSRKSKTQFTYRGHNLKRKRKNSEVGFSSIRGGDVIGEHTVYFLLDGERLELTHRASNRKIFSRGSLMAAEWLFKRKKGLYTLRDMLEL